MRDRLEAGARAYLIDVFYFDRVMREDDVYDGLPFLRYASSVPIPRLLTPYIFTDVANDLEGFNELVRALPIELGPVRWKARVI